MIVKSRSDTFKLNFDKTMPRVGKHGHLLSPAGGYVAKFWIIQLHLFDGYGKVLLFPWALSMPNPPIYHNLFVFVIVAMFNLTLGISVMSIPIPTCIGVFGGSSYLA